jgi:hypothetical protein
MQQRTYYNSAGNINAKTSRQPRRLTAGQRRELDRLQRHAQEMPTRQRYTTH